MNTVKCLSQPNKKRYATQKLASIAALLLEFKLTSYFCEDCMGWHLTKLKKISRYDH